MEAKEEIIIAMKWLLSAILSLISSLIIPIRDFVFAIMILATLNIILGSISDKYWSFKKAFHAFIYLGGYLLLLILSVFVGKLMHISEVDTVDFTSWITWVMIWFYSVNIVRNWSVIQPKNKPIQFFYWVLSFKIIEKIKYLKEFNEKDKENEDNE